MKKSAQPVQRNFFTNPKVCGSKNSGQSFSSLQNHESDEATATILACLRARYNSSDAADLNCRIRDAVAWSKALSTARRHGIVPLVYEGWKASRLPDSAANRLQALQREFRQSAANSFLYAAELVRVSKYLEEQAIDALAFKGPTLALLLYGKLSLRTVRDLDLLVARNQIDPALRALHACGYEPASGSSGASPSVSSKTRKHILLFHRELGFAVELHWAVAESSFVFPLDFEQAWAEHQMVAIMDQPIATLGREHMLLTMCVHGTNHCWGSLKWICDIAQAVIAFHDIDWNRLLARAHTLGCKRMLLAGMALAGEICGAQLPSEVQKLVHSKKIDSIVRGIQARLFAEREPVVNLERTLTFVRSRERFVDRARILLRFIGPELRPNARDRALIHLPACLQVLYFPLRFVRVILCRWRQGVLPILEGAMDRFAPMSPKRLQYIRVFKK